MNTTFKITNEDLGVTWRHSHLAEVFPGNPVVKWEANGSDRSATIDTFFSKRGLDVRVAGVEGGPVVTRYLLEIGDDVMIGDIEKFRRDLGLKLAVGSSKVLIGESVRDGKGYVTVEIPNAVRQSVPSVSVVPWANTDNPHDIRVCLGLSVTGQKVYMDIATAPHVLIAGQSGSGKSVLLNSIICGLLANYSTRQVRTLIVDPKGTEFVKFSGMCGATDPFSEGRRRYNGVVTDPTQAMDMLNWLIDMMENRNRVFASKGVRDIVQYNELVGIDGMLPRVVAVIDEFYDIVAVAGKDFEEAVCRLAAKSRSAGIHLILATQRPSADVVTGRLKANLGTRIALRVSSQVDSRVILDMNGAEALLGRGDMLYMGPDGGTPVRVHGCWLPEEEIDSVVRFSDPSYTFSRRGF